PPRRRVYARLLTWLKRFSCHEMNGGASTEHGNWPIAIHGRLSVGENRLHEAARTAENPSRYGGRHEGPGDRPRRSRQLRRRRAIRLVRLPSPGTPGALARGVAPEPGLLVGHPVRRPRRDPPRLADLLGTAR